MIARGPVVTARTSRTKKSTIATPVSGEKELVLRLYPKRKEGEEKAEVCREGKERKRNAPIPILIKLTSTPLYLPVTTVYPLALLLSTGFGSASRCSLIRCRRAGSPTVRSREATSPACRRRQRRGGEVSGVEE